MTREALRALFCQERAVFARLHPACARARLCIEDRHFLPHPQFRNVAWADSRTGTVHLLRRALIEFDPARLLGLLRHELGHLADGAVMAGGAEQRADDLAERATGRKIRYDRDDLQTIASSGTYPRPRHLPR